MDENCNTNYSILISTSCIVLFCNRPFGNA